MIHIDLNIIDGDLSLDELLSPAQLDKANVIGQDVKHRLIESGLLVQLIGLRNENSIAVILTEIELAVEEDDRLVPGTIQVFYNQDKTISVHANTREYGQPKDVN
jgi:hypothetical protein